MEISNQTLGTLGDRVIAEFCGDIANIPRVFVAQYGGMPLQGVGKECNNSLTSNPTTTTKDEGTDMTTEGEGTDMTTIGNGMINPLESAVQDSIMQNGKFRSVLIQV